MFDACSPADAAFHSHFHNATDVHVYMNTTIVDLLFEEHCIDTLSMVSSLVVVLIALAMLLRCFGLCLHCASSKFGTDLKVVLRDGGRRARNSDSSSDSERSFA